jgi:hypothetical protein
VDLFFAHDFPFGRRGPNAAKPPAFAGGFGSGAIRELEVLYTASVAAVKQLFQEIGQ